MMAMSCLSVIYSCMRMKTRREATLLASVPAARSRILPICVELEEKRERRRMRCGSMGSCVKMGEDNLA